MVIKYRVRMARSEIDCVFKMAEGALNTVELCIQLNSADKTISNLETVLRRYYPNKSNAYLV